jgi:hypothetical protein
MMQIPETYFTIREQTTLFFCACLLGIPAGLLYDGFRFLRLLWRFPAWCVALQDFCFCFCCAVMLAAFTAGACRGEFRIFYLFGLLLGLLLWQLLLGNPLLGVLRRIAERIARLWLPIQQKFQRNKQILKKSKKKCRLHLIAGRHLLYNKRKQIQEVNENGRCKQAEASATAQTKAHTKRRCTVRSTGNRKRKSKRSVSV